MPRNIASPPDPIVEMPFPQNGLDLSCPYSQQRQGTTPVGVNVRFQEALTQRSRGGSRPMLAKYLQAQLAGSNLIQELACVVTTSPAAAVVQPAIAFIQAKVAKYSNSNNDPSRIATTQVVSTSNVTQGNLLVLVFTCDDISGIPSITPTDNLGTIYTLAASENSGSGANNVKVYYGIAGSTGICTVTVTQSFFDYVTLALLEYSGVVPLNPLDSTAVNTQNLGGSSPQNVTTGNVTVNSAGELAIGVFSQGFSTTTFTATNSFTLRVNQDQVDVSPPYQGLYVMDRLGVNGAVAAQGTFTGGVMPTSVASIALSFKAATSYLQRSNTGRLVYLMAIRDGQLYSVPAGGTSWTAAQNVTGQSTPFMLSDGNTLTTTIASAQNGDYVYFADSRNWRRYRPAVNVLETWTTTNGTLPTDSDGNLPRLICNWRQRIVLSGFLKAPQNIVMSRRNDPRDFNIQPTIIDAEAACSNLNAPQPGDTVTGLIPFNDDILFIGGDHTLSMMQGDPLAGGDIQNISETIGVAWGRAWCRGPDGTIYFMSNRMGLYSLLPGQQPQRLSQAIDPPLTAIDTGTQTIRLFWDDQFQGLFVFITNSASLSSATHYYYEVKTGAWWKIIFGDNHFNPCVGCVFDGNTQTDRVTLIGSADGYVRAFSTTAATDDGVACNSEVWYGPLNDRALNEFMLKYIQATLGSTSGTVSFAVHVGRTAEQAVGSTAVASGTWSVLNGHGLNAVTPVRRTGQAVYVKITATVPWAMERIEACVITQGKVRRRVGF